MNDTLQGLMPEIARLTRNGRLAEATAAIQRALNGAVPFSPAAPRSTEADVIDAECRFVDDEPAPVEARPRPASSPDAQPGGRFLRASFANPAGKRHYKLYLPAGPRAENLPLIVMLHGCKQNPDDFAAGTRMNRLADTERCVVLYPAQGRSANGSLCWNWFNDSDQRRDRGEPSIIAGMTRHIIATEGIDARRVYVAGLSAGGAMAATMAASYPDLYAAAAVHSGLPHAAAHDMASAFAAMRQGPLAQRAPRGSAGRALPTIVFHGDRDTTVHPCNGEQVIAAQQAEARSDNAVRVERGRVPGGHAYTRTIHCDLEGRVELEHWLVHGAAHAWSGGSTAGSYTDPRGPDASAEMLRFFREQADARTLPSR